MSDTQNPNSTPPEGSTGPQGPVRDVDAENAAQAGAQRFVPGWGPHMDAYAKNFAQPAEYCGDSAYLPLGGGTTECVLRPGHSGSHANETGTRWSLDQSAQPVQTDEAAWRRKAIRRAIRLGRYETTLNAVRELAAEQVTARSEWGDGYRDALRDLNELLDALLPTGGPDA